MNELKSREFKKKLFISVYLLPPFILYVIAVLYPNIYSVFLSFFSWDGLSPNKVFVWIENFKSIIKDEIVWKALYNNLYFSLWTMLFVITLALFFAFIIVRKDFREKKLYKVLFFFPNIMSIVIVSLLWLFVYNPSFGLLSGAMKSLGMEDLIRVWLGEINIVRKALIVPQVWSAVGFYMLIYIASLQNIPKTLYEAAYLDGANERQQFFKISLPLVWNNIRTTIIYFFAMSFNGGFSLITIMTNGGPNRESEVLVTYMYQRAFASAQYGYGAAISVLILSFTFAVYFLLTKVIRSEVYEY